MGKFPFQIAEKSNLILKVGDLLKGSNLYYGFWFIYIYFRDPNKSQKEYKGVIIYSEGTLYEGHFENDMENGEGRLIFQQLDVYIGEFFDGYRHGKGKFINNDGDFYEGEWKKGLQGGFGTEIFSNGERYEGEFKEGKKEGKGKYMWPNGSEYTGEFDNDLQHGNGIMPAAVRQNVEQGDHAIFGRSEKFRVTHRFIA